MHSELLMATDDDGSPRRMQRRGGAAGRGGALVVVEPATVAATRAALEALADRTEPVGVVGFADLTSPNLVDLLDELQDGPGGRHLRAIAVPWPASGTAWLQDVAVRRGLACLQQRGLALHLVGAGDAALPASLAAVEPHLEVLADPA